VPGDLRAEVYATGLHQPTEMAFGPDGPLYVTEDPDRLVTVRPGARRPKTFVSDLKVPLGLAWIGQTLYISEQGRMESVRLSGRSAVGRRTVLSNLPYGRHQQDNIVVKHGRLFFGSGSTCDVCQEHSPLSAAILSVRPDGGDLRVVARGVRNPFGLAIQPATGAIYATVNGQDELGAAADPEPAEMLVHVRQGAWYGWPTCWPSARSLAMVGGCAGVSQPAAYLEPHSSADGLAFADKGTLPGKYTGDAFVAEWGEYMSNVHGRVVVRIELAPDGARSRVTVFARGFDHPIAVLPDPSGGLLVADWGRGAIYRIGARG
jgi:glucose/arabinose dehydrogenase